MSDKINREDFRNRLMKASLGKYWTEEEIKELLQRNPKAVYKGIVAIYKLQTDDEKVSKETKDLNGLGFNAVDSTILSSFAEQIMKGKQLSPKQFAIASKRIMKYTKQLTMIANEDYY
ncbi:hypothetical protein COF68_04645 [Bacillus toyonensis]|uniref:hypothetical protein n=1 Tax=Bacillus toyonensis TaxID=155322 RepID=UPI000BFC9373|nr:hypothetical protein [Bacillus toyonensis]PHE64142.1 hypothetical protein COF68_04645 [Bacillus toyonensis]